MTPDRLKATAAATTRNRMVAIPKKRRLKVFQAQFGFHDSVVAAPSQAAALRAWGVHQDLFATGEASVTTDEAAVAAATVHPETPLRRAIGSNDPFVLQPTRLPKVPAAPKAPAPGSAAHPRQKRQAHAKPPPDRSRLDRAERELRTIEQRRKGEEADLRREEAALETRKQQAQSAYVEARDAATAKVIEARTAYRAAGGED